MYAQIDEHSQQPALLKDIIDHHSDGSAVKADDGFFIDHKFR
jgi:hypothetical protein